jgi:hypothetical protein
MKAQCGSQILSLKKFFLVVLLKDEVATKIYEVKEKETRTI